VPAVALTAFAMKGDASMAQQAGCDAYIRKPIDTRRFAERIGSVLWAAKLKSSAAPGAPR
jgi:CheY-like chemotaxis protein